MPKKSQKQKLAEYIARKAESKREREWIKNSSEYQPRHPDNK